MLIDAMKELRAGRLARMVRWYDPRLLTRIGVRTMVSSVFGQYADQRLIQAATDQADSKALRARYDYRDPTHADPMQRVTLDDKGAFWVDYIADVADGFESTYTMAYLMAIDKLKVPGLASPLPAGDTLIMGGDQCYPQATREDYKKKLITPYGWAFEKTKPERKLFAIPGNHDWYDGLNAFDSLFCSSRDKLSETKGNTIGGWQCQQHRSYWALRLPYNWWIWGPDIQFSKYLDAAQINYFELIAEQMGPGDNLVICIAEPDWLLADLQGEDDEEENFFKITTIARKRGARVCAVLAGDWHHYNRYFANDIDVHFLTAGGGGAFLHPTHVLKEAISVRWPEKAGVAAAGPEETPEPVWRAHDVDIKLRGAKSTAGAEVAREVGEAVGGVLEPIDDALRGKKRVKRTRILKQEAPVCYPSKGISRLLSLKNLAFPLYNFPFALGIGVIYWLITWQFYSIVERHDISAGKIDAVGVLTGYWETFKYFPLYLIQASLVSIPLVAMLAGVYATLIWYVDATEKPVWRHWFSKIVIGTTHFLAHVTTMFALGFLFVMLNNWSSPYVERQVELIYQKSEAQLGVIGRSVKEALEPLSSARVAQREIYSDKSSPREMRRAAPPQSAIQGPVQPRKAGAATDPLVSKNVRQILGFILYPLQEIIIGGLLGGFVWGLYWTLCSIIMRMHAEDAFAALRIKDYKNFMRMRFDRDTLTIFPIGVDKVPRRSFWRNRSAASAGLSHNPRLVASDSIEVRLIEKPIIISRHSAMETVMDDEAA